MNAPTRFVRCSIFDTAKTPFIPGHQFRTQKQRRIQGKAMSKTESIPGFYGVRINGRHGVHILIRVSDNKRELTDKIMEVST